MHLLRDTEVSELYRDWQDADVFHIFTMTAPLECLVILLSLFCPNLVLQVPPKLFLGR